MRIQQRKDDASTIEHVSDDQPTEKMFNCLNCNSRDLFFSMPHAKVCLYLKWNTGSR